MFLSLASPPGPSEDKAGFGERSPGAMGAAADAVSAADAVAANPDLLIPRGILVVVVAVPDTAVVHGRACCPESGGVFLLGNPGRQHYRSCSA